jgi:hypothetical protein
LTDRIDGGKSRVDGEEEKNAEGSDSQSLAAE